MTEVSILWHGACFTFEVSGSQAEIKEALIVDDRDAQRHYGSLGVSEPLVAGRSLFVLDKNFKAQVLEMAGVNGKRK